VKRFGDADSLRQVVVEGIGPATASRRGHMVVTETTAAYGKRKATRKGSH
jgi:hypothetical protein